MKLFPEMTELRNSGKCPGCGKLMTNPEFRDSISIREFEITGMCQECQDDIENTEVDTDDDQEYDDDYL
jgi:hypothetical protein